MSVGSAVFTGNSKLFEGPLGVVQVGFAGYDLGKTTADTVITPDQDIKDINYQQDGSKAADHVRTGIDYLLAVTFGEISTGLLDLLMSGISTQNVNPAADSGTIDRVMYESMRDVEAGGLKIAACDVNGTPLATLQNIMNFYEAIPIVNGDLVNWGADTQRNFAMQFRIKWHEWTAAELVTLTLTGGGAFGYWGTPATENVIDIGDYFSSAPRIDTIVATAATTILVTYDKNVEEQTAWEAGHVVIEVDGVWKLSTADGGYVGKIWTCTSIGLTDADVLRICISRLLTQDTETPAHTFLGIDGYPVVNEVV